MNAIETKKVVESVAARVHGLWDRWLLTDSHSAATVAHALTRVDVSPELLTAIEHCFRSRLTRVTIQQNAHIEQFFSHLREALTTRAKRARRPVTMAPESSAAA